MKNTKEQKQILEAEIRYVHYSGLMKGQGLAYGLRADDPLRKKHRHVYNKAVNKGKKIKYTRRKK